MNKFDNNFENSWCPGCGNFGIQKALKEALVELELNPSEVLIVSGIGQAAKLPHFINANGFNGLHGRALPAAFGALCANQNMKIIVITGDGDGYGEGGNHFIHNVRRNLDILHIVHDNQIYGLTKGQGSPTTGLGQKTTLQIDGVKNEPLNPIAMAVALNISFVARGFSGDIDNLKELIKAGLSNKGYSLIDVMQPCISFNKVNTNKWYKDRAYYLGEDYDPNNPIEAFKKSMEFGDEGIPMGIIYKNSKKTYMETLDYLDKPLVQYKKSPTDLKKILEKIS
jgi:2-oxoglutarate ferredoxin oxidoreductase subunit beta